MEPKDIKFMQSLIKEWVIFSKDCEHKGETQLMCEHPDKDTHTWCNGHTCPLGREP